MKAKSIMTKLSRSTRHPRSSASLLAAAATVLLASPLLHAADGTASLFDMSLEELVNLKVTSVSQKSERLAETTSAVYVITHEDIIQYGISSIPEALRLAPGLSVLQIDANKWAVGSRGDTGRFSNKLLVLMDGRVLYTPSFSGVFWDVQDTNLDDIARIEVIRGPGAAIWGANAVNGVINIITRSADAGDGGSLATRIEDDGTYVTAAAFSHRLADQADYRVFLKHQDASGNSDLLGQPVADGWEQTRAGFRADWSPAPADHVAFISEIYDGRMGTREQFVTTAPPFTGTQDSDTSVSGAFVIGRWAHEHSATANSNLQVTLDVTDRQSVQFAENRHTYAVDFQHQRTLPRHDLVMGASYHSNGYELAGSARISVPDLSPRDRSMSIFLQDEVAVVPDKLRLTFGAKLENNELSNRDLDVMPTVRLLWQIKKDAALWAAVTRAIRTPSYADLGAHAIDIVPAVPPGAAGNPFPVPLRVSATGTPGFGSEEITAHEMGVRGRLTPTVSYDVALYDMSYDKLRATQPADVVCNPSGTSVFANPLCLLTSDSATTELLFVNGAQGNVRGAELAADWDARDNWRIRASYAVTRESLSAPAPLGAAATVTPRNQLNLRSEWSLRPDVRLALWLRHVGSIESMSIDDYWQANLQVNWRPKDHWQLSFGAKNLLGTRLEFISEFNDVVPTQIERRYYIAAQWRF